MWSPGSNGQGRNDTGNQRRPTNHDSYDPYANWERPSKAYSPRLPQQQQPSSYYDAYNYTPTFDNYSRPQPTQVTTRQPSTYSTDNLGYGAFRETRNVPSAAPAGPSSSMTSDSDLGWQYSYGSRLNRPHPNNTPIQQSSYMPENLGYGSFNGSSENPSYGQPQRSPGYGSDTSRLANSNGPAPSWARQPMPRSSEDFGRSSQPNMHPPTTRPTVNPSMNVAPDYGSGRNSQPIMHLPRSSVVRPALNQSTPPKSNVPLTVRIPPTPPVNTIRPGPSRPETRIPSQMPTSIAVPTKHIIPPAKPPMDPSKIIDLDSWNSHTTTSQPSISKPTTVESKDSFDDPWSSSKDGHENSWPSSNSDTKTSESHWEEDTQMDPLAPSSSAALAESDTTGSNRQSPDFDSDSSAQQMGTNPYEEFDKYIEAKQATSSEVSSKTESLENSMKNLDLDKTPTPSKIQSPTKSVQPIPQWTTPVPTRFNLPPPPEPGSLWGGKQENTVQVKEEKKPNLVHPDYLAKLRQLESQKNVFTQFYPETKKDNKKPNQVNTVKNYRHTNALDFATVSQTWSNKWDSNLPVLSRCPRLVIPLPSANPSDDTVCAYYRVLAERDQKYILIACHVNLHGYHRGDLRFVEVNARSELDGFPGQSVLGNLFLGDVLAVTDLARNSNSIHASLKDPVSSVTQDTPCYWIVAKMILQPRYQSAPVTFSFLKNRMAVVKGDDEPMRVTVENWDTVSQDLIYTGECFKPNKLENNFTEDFYKKKKNLLISKALRIASYPNAFGTIFSFKECTEQNEQFAIGIDAFSAHAEIPTADRERIVETCSLMGFSAANTIFNGRFDCRAFHMNAVTKSGQFVKFRIDNPQGQPTLGLWNAGNKILFGGPDGDMNAVIETVIAEDNRTLRISARLSRDVPRNINFHVGEYFVSQREITDHYFLYEGYFQALEPESNGRRIIETLYGAKSLELIKTPPALHKQYYFPSVPEVLALNQYQNEYVQMLLDGNPLIIGSSPFGCGKSMTIITAALEIYKRNLEEDILCNQRQQLLITQSNFASVNLIEIAKRVCSNTDTNLRNLKFVRFVSEKNWNELADNCRTDYDMPYLMNGIFCAWARGQFDENDRRVKRLQNLHFNHMLAYILKNQLLQPAELVGAARRAYDRNGDLKNPYSGNVTEAFFLLYQPDLIMTTADSSKSLLSVLKEICTVQIDEASQLPEYTLLGLLKTFNKANFGLIGDIHQLPPYCEDNLDGKLKDYGIGNTMERAIKGHLFPTSILRYVYRCHPRITELLSELFYDGALLSGVQENQRNEFAQQRSDFWPNQRFPMMIVNHEGSSFKMGTSTGNDSEKDLVGKLIQNLISHPNYPVNSKDIGVISFYAAQTSILTEHLRGSGVKCGTVDAFQGTEKEIIIMCCTNASVSEFMQLSNRLNVAMSRAKQATVIIGNVEGLRRAKYWNRIVQKVEENGNVVQASNFKAKKELQQSQLSYLPQNFNVQLQQPQQHRQLPPQSYRPFPQQQKPPLPQNAYLPQDFTYAQNVPVQPKKAKKQKSKAKASPIPIETFRAKENQRQNGNTKLQGKWDENTVAYSAYPNGYN